MSDASHPDKVTAGASPVRREWETAVRIGMYCGIAFAAGLVVLAGLRALGDRAALQAGEKRLVALHGLVVAPPKRLAAGFQDQDGNLIADEPSGAEALDPAVLVVTHYEGDDDGERVDWPGFQKLLGQATGKTVELKTYQNSPDDVAGLKSGEVHIAAVHAADTPYLVNHAGFVPVGVLGSKEGASGNHLVIAASVKSKLRSLAEVRGRRLTCTRPDSITGYRAAIAVLSRDEGLRPSVDYRIHFSFGQKRSIEGLVAGEYEVAALSADKLAEMLAEGTLKRSDYRVLYESQVIPRLTIGHLHNLAPQLSEQIRRVVREFDNQGATESGPPMRFVPIDYQKDFAFVRRIDDSFDPRIGQVAKRGP